MDYSETVEFFFNVKTVHDRVHNTHHLNHFDHIQYHLDQDNLQYFALTYRQVVDHQ